MLGVICTAVPTAQTRATPSGEIALKAAFVSKFPHFIEWPSQVMVGRGDLEICVPMGAAVEAPLVDLVAGYSVNGLSMRVRGLAPTDRVTACHLLYLPNDGTTDRAARLREAVGQPIVTVSDASDFLAAGGMIRLRLEREHLRFDINLTPAEASGLRLSSQLLRLAGRVMGGR
jgi:hypothetical protein